MSNKTQALFDDELKKIVIFKGTACSTRECHDMGCAFPYCAIFTGEEYDTIEDAKVDHPDVELIKNY